MAELQGLQLHLDEFRERGVAVAAVVVDPTEVNARLAADAGLAFPILSDRRLVAADAYALRHREGHDGQDIARSASILIDADGVVRWTSVTDNVRRRPAPETILAAAAALPRR